MTIECHEVALTNIKKGNRERGVKPLNAFSCFSLFHPVTLTQNDTFWSLFSNFKYGVFLSSITTKNSFPYILVSP